MTEKQYNWVIAKGLDFNQFFTLLLWDKNTLDSKITGWKFLLEKKGYLDPNKQITAEGEDLIQEYKELSEEKVVTSFNLGVWCEHLHTKLETRLEALTGKRQKTDKIKGKSYSFLPNKVDLQKKVQEVVKKYNCKEYQKIETTLLNYINSCYKENSYFPLLKYYILKDNESSLMTDLTNEENEIEELGTKLERIKTKDLF